MVCASPTPSSSLAYPRSKKKKKRHLRASAHAQLVARAGALAHIDAQAEREADAIERLAEFLGEPVPMSRLQRARLQAMEAADRGLPPVRAVYYCKVAAIKEFDRLARGGTPHPLTRMSTREEKQRRFERRMRRYSMLLDLAKVPANRPPVPLKEACRLAHVSERTLHRAIRLGEIQPLRVGKHVFIRHSDLHKILSRLLAPQGAPSRAAYAATRRLIEGFYIKGNACTEV